jgi:hypothetical protein
VIWEKKPQGAFCKPAKGRSQQKSGSQKRNYVPTVMRDETPRDMSLTHAVSPCHAGGMNTRPSPVSLKPTPTDASVYLMRACYAHALHVCNPYESSPEAIARERWGDSDSVTRLVIKAASAPATTTNATWAGALSQNVVGDFIQNLAPISAAASLFAAAERRSLVGVSSISFPQRAGLINPASVPWLAEGSPFPVLQYQTSRTVQLGPTRKLAAATAMTRELLEGGNGLTELTRMLSDDAVAKLDSFLFSNTAAGANSPAGILAGVTPLTAATGGGKTALENDLAALAKAIAGVTSTVAFIANPAQANMIPILREFPLPFPVWPTIQVPAGTVIGLDPKAFCSAFNPTPEISATAEGLLHFEDTTPQQIGTVGTPNVVAAPTQSLWQRDYVAVRLFLRCAWCWRVPGAVAWVQNTTW